jgi:hypothetical protein
MDRREDADEERDWPSTDAGVRDERQTAGEVDQVPGPEGNQPATTATAEREQQAERERDAERGRDEGAGGAEQPAGSLASPPPGSPQAEWDREGETAAAGQQAVAEVLPASERPGYRERWDALQAGFIDDPGAAARQADALIGELLRRFTERHESLRGRIGGSGEGSDTESMRLVVREYRVIFTSLVGE